MNRLTYIIGLIILISSCKLEQEGERVLTEIKEAAHLRAYQPKNERCRPRIHVSLGQKR